MKIKNKNWFTHLLFKIFVPVILLNSSNTLAEKFEAEDYNNYFDASAGNAGGAYRNDDVDIETCLDDGGGFNVGWIDSNEWLVFNELTIPTSGDYIIRARVASPNGGSLSIDLNGGAILLGQLTVPDTGGWQNWQSVETTAHINAGTYDLGVFALSGGWNLNWIEILADSAPATDILVQAEDYDDASDSTPGNTGGAYRTGDVDIQVTSDLGGGFNVGWWEAGEWLAFNNIEIPSSGNYQIRARVASPSGAQASFDLNGGTTLLGQITIPSTGGWQSWQTVTLDTHLTQGVHSLGVYGVTSGWNLNWIEIVAGGNGPVNPEPPGNITWQDEFNSIDTNNWNFETGGSGWGNNELQWYTNGSNAMIEFDPQANSNVLVIEARQEQGGACWWGGNCGYTSTRMNTRFKHSFQYGRIEARMKLPRAQGIWPAFWMLGDAFNTIGWPDGGELDIMEHVGWDNVTTGALHGPGYSGNTPINGHLVHNQNIDETYHVYAVEWDANGIRWFVDDNNFYSVTKAQVEQFGPWVYDQPFWILLNVAVGGNWPGDPDHANFTTQRLYVDYVRVIQ